MTVTLGLVAKARTLNAVHPVGRLYRSIMKEVPKVLTIYDIDIPIPEARATIRNQFRKNAAVKDSRVVEMLVERGYMELEDTLLQWKQRPHLIRFFEGYVVPDGALRKGLGSAPTIEEQFNRA
mmetsp:Transcript_10764/g.15742  ORF Transcript_10764/g.15742 Transcript_10764/m.15742 type:complete len:123 (-) Transcript_10764:352-720(-)|eukprot:CAMPEP_0195517664 /NCGR_PEP_ID=MMETSP0794_2-20130614/11219_1 /TAXON_ID=515487 /ORGANISM="Stephanopyxis turris, Strain CCMP 815" /LENGTH=122 /DNA_ID=CAMNT_0040646503 /DNA_START=99 /DNA_END=467 /DNA_ORIENTATION=-